MRLIDADALLDDIRSHSASYFADDFAREWVDKQPTVDAVPVIRCKDCMFFQINKFDDTHLEMMCTENYDGYGAYMSTRPDYFCSNAEREEK